MNPMLLNPTLLTLICPNFLKLLLPKPRCRRR